jgi:adenylylsulfate kinase
MVLIAEAGADGAPTRARWLGGGPHGRPVEARRRIWFQPPDRVRVEVLHGRSRVRTAVRDGSAWWRWDQQEGESAGDLVHGIALPPLLDIPLLRPTRLLHTMWLEVNGQGTRAGREVLMATATPREGPTTPARRSELDFDVEHGTPLHAATFEDGVCISVNEVLSVDYSPTIDPGIFKFEQVAKPDGPVPAPAPLRPTSAANGAVASSERLPSLAHSVLPDRQTIWLTGLSGAGKSTIARAIERLLHQLGISCCVLDGDELRRGLSSDLGLAREDRREQARRVAHVAASLTNAGVIPIVSLVSPYAEDRQLAREIHSSEGLGFLEVWVDTPLDICAARDTKGLYAAARALGTLPINGGPPDGSGLTGLTAPYEIPANPDLLVTGHDEHPRVAAAQIVRRLISHPARTRVLTPDFG